jgi:dinuclear metal center YbgI/SA1388 family protein
MPIKRPSGQPLLRHVALTAVVQQCDTLLRTQTIGDYPGAANGLQVQNAGTVTRIAAAVDASLATIQLAVAAGADLLLVHHGLFWNSRQPWTGQNYELIRLLTSHNLAVYSSHLPLDAHPKLGNNALLCAALGLKSLTPFFTSHGQPIGFQARANISRTELAQRLARATDAEPRLIPGGNEQCRRIGVVTGGAGGDLKLAAAEGVDTFITGEGPHWTYALAEELRLNVFYAGHYATETFGVKALAAWLAQKHKIPWSFIDHPSGL